MNPRHSHVDTDIAPLERVGDWATPVRESGAFFVNRGQRGATALRFACESRSHSICLLFRKQPHDLSAHASDLSRSLPALVARVAVGAVLQQPLHQFCFPLARSSFFGSADANRSTIGRETSASHPAPAR